MDGCRCGRLPVVVLSSMPNLEHHGGYFVSLSTGMILFTEPGNKNTIIPGIFLLVVGMAHAGA